MLLVILALIFFLLSEQEIHNKLRLCELCFPKVKPSAGPLFLSKKTSRDRERVLKNALNLLFKWYVDSEDIITVKKILFRLAIVTRKPKMHEHIVNYFILSRRYYMIIIILAKERLLKMNVLAATLKK
jgi:hypothetical protein